jgi:hypothetical protein
MKNIFREWVLRKAEKINKENQAELDRWKKHLEEEAQKTKLCKDALYKHLQVIFESMSTGGCHLEEGDSVVINVYSLGRDGNNGWDGGPLPLLRYINPVSPVTLRITKVYVDSSYAYELIDRFISSVVTNDVTETNVIASYESWLDRLKNRQIGNRYGLYKTAHFTYEGPSYEFVPKWGLNVDCFLVKGTPEYDETCQVWEQEIQIEKSLAKLDKKRKALEAEKKAIMEKYRRIYTQNLNS